MLACHATNLIIMFTAYRRKRFLQNLVNGVDDWVERVIG